MEGKPEEKKGLIHKLKDAAEDNETQIESDIEDISDIDEQDEYGIQKSKLALKYINKGMTYIKCV